MLVQRFEPHGRRLTDFHYYYYSPATESSLSEPWKGLTRKVELDPHSELDCLYVFVRTLERSDQGGGTRPS